MIAKVLGRPIKSNNYEILVTKFVDHKVSLDCLNNETEDMNDNSYSIQSQREQSPFYKCLFSEYEKVIQTYLEQSVKMIATCLNL